ncbi:hypothetical protein BpHYR1_038052 [Brachionus plicatilis]|uniref:Uncharacterized protein n=1 Tax=Brachionus plicatilis TaxID=10195 RepID=A0A3M7P352_BRAPC|nr:hypothetical protein BpHYR1_038052 [Brachionus plicatilis]
MIYVQFSSHLLLILLEYLISLFNVIREFLINYYGLYVRPIEKTTAVISSDYSKLNIYAINFELIIVEKITYYIHLFLVE